MNLMDKLRDIVQRMNASGVPLPMIRVDGKASFTATMTFISFNTALLGQIGKVTNFLGPVDLTQANYLFGICLAAHLGRRLIGDGKKMDIEGSAKKED
jgi:hypothetical protein